MCLGPGGVMSCRFCAGCALKLGFTRMGFYDDLEDINNVDDSDDGSDKEYRVPDWLLALPDQRPSFPERRKIATPSVRKTVEVVKQEISTSQRIQTLEFLLHNNDAGIPPEKLREFLLYDPQKELIYEQRLKNLLREIYTLNDITDTIGFLKTVPSDEISEKKAEIDRYSQIISSL